MWSAELGYKTIFSGKASNQVKVAILFNSNFGFNFSKVLSHPNSTYIICNIGVDKKCITEGTLYAPNDDDPSFFDSRLVHLLDFEFEDVILRG